MNTEQILRAADRLAQPTVSGLPTEAAWWPQSLAHGIPGVTLLHAELAAAGLRSWHRVHDWLTVAARHPVTTGPSAGLFYGAPALAFTLTCVATVRSGSYHRALDTLDANIAADARSRVARAHDRITAGRLPDLAEFDTLRGLAGIGAYLLRRSPGSDALREVLAYLVALTAPLRDNDGSRLPGWWTTTGPTGRPEADFPGGHGNAGMAHGIAGGLALLALAALRGIRVPGHQQAIDTVCAWLDSWRTDTGTGPRWPYLVRRTEQESGRPHPHTAAVRRPSWCYGTAGLARAQQLAALATGDIQRRRTAEAALLHALTDPAQRTATTDASLCHGFAGLGHIAARAAVDAEEPSRSKLRSLSQELTAHAQPAPDDGPGVLEGISGVALAAFTAKITGLPPATGWDTCLLIA